MSKEVMERFRDELVPFRASTTTLHFTPVRPLPALLVTRFVRAQVTENEQRAAEKKRYGK